ncbi:MAG: FlgO family outer membrane protein [Sulfurospirillaceae bacterium]|jgi:TolB-like protein|nr:FlgO family outer membrane protein [Sulfurospirillaceae bacterium]MDD2826810.1 FlgO family outer membrane protein [Sulfurospirillaceae bacterium]
MKISYIIGTIILAFLLNGCVASNQTDLTHSVKYDMTSINYKAAEKLLLDANLPLESVIIMATVVNIDDIENSSTLGRLISEQISARFIQAKMNVIEMKFRENIYMKQNTGELMLTRDIGKIAKTYSANAVIVGTYAVANSAVYVNIKIINPSTNVAIAATDYVLPMNRDVDDMISKKSHL